MNRRSLKIADIACTVAVIAVYLYCVVKLCAFYSSDILTTILFLIAGFVIAILASSLFHELGHLIFGLVCKLKLVEFKVLCFKIYYDKKRYRFTLSFNFGDLGETTFVPCDDVDNKKRLKLATFGGLLFSFIIFISYVLVAVFTMGKSQILSCLFGAHFLLPFYVFTVNFIPFRSTTDGFLWYKLACDDETSEMITNVFTLGGLLYSGVEPKKLPEKYFTPFVSGVGVYSVALKYYKYLHLLLTDEKAAYAELECIYFEEDYKQYISEEISAELFYVAINKCRDEYIKLNAEQVIDYLAKDDTPASKRIQFAYRIYTGETEWAKLLYESWKYVVENESGADVGKLEKELFLSVKSRAK